MPEPTALTPAFPTVADMLGAHLLYVYARPYQREAMIETGVIVGYQHCKGEFYLKMQPDNPVRFPRWISENDFLSYVHNAKAAA